jgi:choline dehydrogenase-like flavoprotein
MALPSRATKSRRPGIREPRLPASFLDARGYEDGLVVHCDVCIVGTGAAGVSAVLRLRGSNLDVFVLEAGGLQPDPVATSMSELELGDLSVGSEARLRYFGGTTNIWSGGLAMLQGIDLRPRPWVPLSSWPIRADELAQYYRNAWALFGVPDLTGFDVAALSARRGFILRTSMLDAAYAYWLRRPLRFGTALITATKRSLNVRTALHANLTEIVLNSAGTLVDRLVVRTTNGRRFFIRPKVTILACGGIENPRILLASRGQRAKGIANEFDQVGRYYMDHPKGRCGIVHLAPDVRRYPHPAYWSGRPMRLRLGVRLSDQAQERYGALNSYVRFRPILQHEGSGIEALRAVIRRRWRMIGDFRTLTSIVAQFPEVVSAGKFWISNRGPVKAMEIDNFMEQAPVPENRVSLSEKQDIFGNPLARLDWSISEQDKRTMRVLHARLDREMRSRSIGWLESPLLSDESSPWPIDGDASHHMGTTRMGVDPRISVVDPDCRVHGIDNLFIAGSSVFPTSGYANPTLTIVALALRVSDHIKRTVSS